MKILSKIIGLILRACAVLILTAPLAVQLIRCAYEERGYNAVGGEWLAILFIAAGVWWLIGYVLKSDKDTFEVQKTRIQESHHLQNPADPETEEM